MIWVFSVCFGTCVEVLRMLLHIVVCFKYNIKINGYRAEEATLPISVFASLVNDGQLFMSGPLLGLCCPEKQTRSHNVISLCKMVGKKIQRCNYTLNSKSLIR